MRDTEEKSPQTEERRMKRKSRGKEGEKEQGGVIRDTEEKSLQTEERPTSYVKERGEERRNNRKWGSLLDRGQCE